MTRLPSHMKYHTLKDRMHLNRMPTNKISIKNFIKISADSSPIQKRFADPNAITYAEPRHPQHMKTKSSNLTTIYGQIKEHVELIGGIKNASKKLSRSIRQKKGRANCSQKISHDEERDDKMKQAYSTMKKSYIHRSKVGLLSNRIMESVDIHNTSKEYENSHASIGRIKTSRPMSTIRSSSKLISAI